MNIKNLNNKRNIIIIFLAVMAVYINAIFNPFIFDDFALVVNNPYIKNFLNFPYYWTHNLFINGTSGFYRPLQTILYAVIYHLFGLNVVSYHLLNIFLHAGNAILIYILLKKLYSEKVSFLISLLWAIHPIQTQAVTYMSGTADPLCLFWTLLTILFFSTRRYIFSIFSFIFALLSKETAILTPFLIYIYEYTRVSSAGFLPSYKYDSFRIFSVPLYEEQTIDFKQKPSTTKILWLCTFLGASILYSILRITILVPFKSSSMGTVPFLSRFYTSFHAFLQYIQLLIFPNILAMERYIPYIKTWKNPDFIAGFICFVLFLYWLYKIRKNPGLFFPGIWFLLNYIAIMNVIIPINSNIAEEWMYTPSIGFFILFILGYEKIKDIFLNKLKTKNLNSVKIKKYVYIPLIIIFCLYGTRTIVRNTDWKNPVIFYKKAIVYFPYQKLYNNLASTYLSEHKYHHAIKYFKIVLQYSPDYYTAILGIGDSYIKLKKIKKAEPYLKKAAIEGLKSYPDNMNALYGIASLFEKTGQTEKSMEVLKWIVKNKPFFSPAYFLLGKIYFKERNYKKAAMYLNSEVQLNPQDYRAYYLLCIIYLNNKDFISAFQEIGNAVKLKPENTTFLIDAARLCQLLKMNEKAIVYFKRYLSIKPDNLSALNDMAISFAVLGKKQQAIKIWENILKKNPGFSEAKINLEKTLK
ncbi:MAG: tetratricopeptide repeat protein [Candidatus Omnitrophica bacterium]|nr:tetratricopeptide repeat protein [Candidatus Omnitrophota bacterium]